MNIYFLLEGRSTEKKIYSSWLNYLLPELTKVKYYHQVARNNYCLVSAHGYPSIIHEYIPDAIEKIRETGKYSYLVICIDAEEETVESKIKEIDDFIVQNNLNLELGNVKFIPIIQNRCIETWLLGNRKMFNSRQPLSNPLLDYVKYYDVSIEDPELMGNYSQDYNHAEFHYLYLKEIFSARNSSYSKKLPRDAQNKSYLDELIKRVEDETEHLKTFQNFINFCWMIKQQLC